jgi:hypothetical protein
VGAVALGAFSGVSPGFDFLGHIIVTVGTCDLLERFVMFVFRVCQVLVAIRTVKVTVDGLSVDPFVYIERDLSALDGFRERIVRVAVETVRSGESHDRGRGNEDHDSDPQYVPHRFPPLQFPVPFYFSQNSWRSVEIIPEGPA